MLLVLVEKFPICTTPSIDIRMLLAPLGVYATLDFSNA
jgi:hypothetical protein